MLTDLYLNSWIFSIFISNIKEKRGEKEKRSKTFILI